jgi:hypothetical protein
MSRFTKDGGTAINIPKLAITVFGTITGTIMGGYADIISAYFTAFFINPIRSLAEFLRELVSLPFDVIGSAAQGSTDTTIAFVQQFGLFGLVVSVGIMLLTYTIVVKGWDYAG